MPVSLSTSGGGGGGGQSSAKRGLGNAAMSAGRSVTLLVCLALVWAASAQPTAPGKGKGPAHQPSAPKTGADLRQMVAEQQQKVEACYKGYMHSMEVALSAASELQAYKQSLDDCLRQIPADPMEAQQMPMEEIEALLFNLQGLHVNLSGQPSTSAQTTSLQAFLPPGVTLDTIMGKDSGAVALVGGSSRGQMAAEHLRPVAQGASHLALCVKSFSSLAPAGCARLSTGLTDSGNFFYDRQGHASRTSSPQRTLCSMRRGACPLHRLPVAPSRLRLQSRLLGGRLLACTCWRASKGASS